MVNGERALVPSLAGYDAGSPAGNGTARLLIQDVEMNYLSTHLQDDLKTAIRASDTTRRDVLRFLRAELQNAEIQRQRPLTDEEIIEVIRRQIKRRRESIDQFARGGRQDLVAAEEAEIGVLEAYLPAQMTYEAVLEIARDVVRELGAQSPKEMGRVMPALRARIGTQAEGGVMAAAAREVLNGNQSIGGAV
jgi:uncharacterized protein YqeY